MTERHQRIVNGRTDLVFDHIAEAHPATEIVDGVPLIRWCFYYGDVSAMRYLMAHGESLSVIGVNYDIVTAAYHGHWRLCEFLIENGADVNIPDPEAGETCLHAALSKANRWKYTPVVKLLLAHGANPNATTIPGRSTGAFMRDVRTRGETPLHRAAAFGNEQDIQALLEAGAKRDARDVNGDSPLSWASWYLRPGSILEALCHAPYNQNDPRRRITTGAPADGSMDGYLHGKPNLRKE